MAIPLSTNWPIYKVFTITGSGSSQTSKCLRVVVNYDAGLMREDMKDIRFSSDGFTTYEQFLAYREDSVKTIWYVLFDDIPADGLIVRVYMGNDDAPWKDDLDKVALWYDNFHGDLSKWVTVSSGDPYVTPNAYSTVVIQDQSCILTMVGGVECSIRADPATAYAEGYAMFFRADSRGVCLHNSLAAIGRRSSSWWFGSHQMRAYPNPTSSWGYGFSSGNVISTAIAAAPSLDAHSGFAIIEVIHTPENDVKFYWEGSLNATKEDASSSGGYPAVAMSDTGNDDYSLEIDHVGVFALAAGYTGGESPELEDVPGDAYFESLSPAGGMITSPLSVISVRIKSDSTVLDADTISVNTYNNIYTNVNSVTEEGTLVLTQITVSDILITLTLNIPPIGDRFDVIFNGSDITGYAATECHATYYLWGGQGTIDAPFDLQDSSVIAFAEPGPTPTRWEHVYDAVKVDWQFRDASGSVLRGLARGAKKTLSISSNPLIQSANLAGHSSDALLGKFGVERKVLEQELPFAPFIELFDVVRLLYPTTYYRFNRTRKWVTSDLKLSPKTGRIIFKGVESYE